MSTFSCATMRSSGTVGNAVKYFAPQPPLSSPVCQTNSSDRFGRGPAARLRHLHQRHHARSVVVGAVVDLVLTRDRGRSRACRMPGLAAQVIEMSAERDELVPQHRVGALDAGDDVDGVLTRVDAVV